MKQLSEFVYLIFGNIFLQVTGLSIIIQLPVTKYFDCIPKDLSENDFMQVQWMTA